MICLRAASKSRLNAQRWSVSGIMTNGSSFGCRSISSNFIVVNDAEEFKSVQSKASKKIYYFTATWCPPCRMIAPHFKELSEKHSSINFVKIDIDQCEEVAREFAIKSVPTFIFSNGNTVLGQFAGADQGKLQKGIAALELETF